MSISFDWLTRLYCSFPNHDTTLSVILKFVFCNKDAVMLEQNKLHRITEPSFKLFKIYDMGNPAPETNIQCQWTHGGFAINFM